MKRLFFALAAVSFALLSPVAQAATSVSQWGITWTFDKDYPTGQFCNGDYWVVGPVKVVGISTTLHAPGFTPKPGEDGSMVNPGTDAKQGYDNRLDSYKAELNAGLIGGQPVGPGNPLALKADSSLVSMVSWLYRSETDAEPGIPKFNGGTKAPRPVTRSGAVLTVLPAAPAKGSFRPPYAGADKTVKFNQSQLDLSKLKNYPPVADTPDPAKIAETIQRPWIDHVNEFLGAMVHPSENMPNYGREIGIMLDDAALMLQIDFSKLPGSPSKEKLAIEYAQLGIDLAGIADNGGYWPANGGHHIGRKLPILLTGVLLNDAHMKDAGHWKTRFQDDEQTFFVSQAEVDMTHSPAWKPDKRSKDGLIPYEKEDIGMPEWGIVHAKKPEADNKAWTATYRIVNGPVIPGIVLAARMMGLEDAWNHKPLFDYADRYMKKVEGEADKQEQPSSFHKAMWKMYAAQSAANTGAAKPK